MTKNKDIVCLILCLVVILVLLGCRRSSRVEPPTVTDKSLAAKASTTIRTPNTSSPSYIRSTPIKVTQTPIDTPSPTSSTTSTSTPSPTSSVTSTPLSIDDVQYWIMEKMDDNGGCSFPCWWGITPGSTTWEEAEGLLYPYASRVGIYEGDDGWLHTGVSFYDPPKDVAGEALYLDFSVLEGVVQRIYVSGMDTTSKYQLPALMNIYGKPGGIWVYGYSPWFKDYGPRGLEMHLYYPEYGFIAGFYSIWGEVDNGVLTNCISQGPTFELWSPNSGYSYPEPVGETVLYVLPFLTISDALDMDVETFYNTYKGENNEVCVESMVETWDWDALPWTAEPEP